MSCCWTTIPMRWRPDVRRPRGLTETDRATWADYVRHIAPLAGKERPEAPPELAPEPRRCSSAGRARARAAAQPAARGAPGRRSPAGRARQFHLEPLPHRQARAHAHARPAWPHGAARLPRARRFPASRRDRPPAMRRGDHRARFRPGGRRDPPRAAALAQPGRAPSAGARRGPSAPRQYRRRAPAAAPPAMTPLP